MSSTKRKGDPLNGILLLDKPAAMTSNRALQQVKRLLGARKAGHTGSLDPMATGLLPICLGDVTKLSRFFLAADKIYRTRFKLGETTDTGDCDGAVQQRRSVVVTDADIERALELFRGEIEQIPPMYSALKVHGQPLYKLARQGIEIDREPRQVTIHSLTVDAFDGEALSLSIHCSSGFYVRSLAYDLGERLGCGAYVDALRRTRVGQFDIEDAVSLESLIVASGDQSAGAFGGRRYLLAPDLGLDHIPQVRLSVDAAFYLCRGQAVRAADVPTAGWVRLYSDGAGFLGLGTVLDDGRIAPKRLFQHHGAVADGR